MAQRKRGGCGLLPLLVILGLILIFRDNGAPPKPLERQVIGGEDNPRRPMPAPDAPEYEIAEDGPPQDSQGTAFAVGDGSVWLTADHVVRGCDLVGVEQGDGTIQRADRVVESSTNDAARIEESVASNVTLPIGTPPTREGSAAYHMGFPQNEPAVVTSELIGEAFSVQGKRERQPVLVWAETARSPEFDHALGGISGGPTFDASGRVIGINSAASDRRGRVITVDPRSVFTGPEGNAPPIGGTAQAVALFRDLVARGAIRRAYCDVTANDKP